MLPSGNNDGGLINFGQLPELSTLADELNKEESSE
jgi:hypothetical protein